MYTYNNAYYVGLCTYTHLLYLNSNTCVSFMYNYIIQFSKC